MSLSERTAQQPKIICVTNRRLAGEDFLKRIKKVAASGVDAVILREKDLNDKEYGHLAAQAAAVCAANDVMFICHNHIDVAAKLGIRRIHLPVAGLLAMQEQEKKLFDIIGASVHSVDEAKAAQQAGAAYVTAGHIFETDCKRNLAPRGLSFLGEVCRSVSIPVCAIGGITADNAAACMETGAKGICLMSSLMQAENPSAYIGDIREKLRG